MLIAYIEKNFAASSLEIIDRANRIITDFDRMGLTLTLRQLYYQFVSKDWMPNKQTEYKRLGSIITDARMAGLIDWEAMEDRTRKPVIYSHTETAKEAVDDLAGMVDKDQWVNQERAVEVWIEKDALTGVIQRPCNQLDVPYFACKGYNSASAAWQAGQRILKRFEDNGQQTVILHLGDHDPSGIDMTHDIEKRFNIFTDGAATIDRIALNMSQIQQFNPPPNPTKLSDSRANSYVALYGMDCWELDALDPQSMQTLIEDNIKKYIDQALWDATKAEQKEENEKLDQLIEHFDYITDEILPDLMEDGLDDPW